MATIEPRGKGKWLVRVFLGREVGRQKRHSQLIHGSKKDALGYARKIETARDNGTLAELLHPPEPSATLTLGAFLDTWLCEVVRIKVSANTLTAYENLLKWYVRPALGSLPLTEIGPEHVQSVYNAMRDRELSPRTIRYTHTVLSAALRKAVSWRRIPSNPALDTERPKQQRVRPIEVFSPKAAVKFIEAAQPDPLGALFIFALGTGARPEEYTALDWSALNLEEAWASVRRVVVWASKGGGWAMRDYPKTTASFRTLDLQPQLVAALQEHRKRQLAERLARGSVYHYQGLVFATSEGGPLARRNIYRRHMAGILERAKLPASHTLYSLRHSFATLSLAAAADAKHISAALGHKSVAFTLDTYTHLVPALRKDAAAKLEKLLFRKQAAG